MTGGKLRPVAGSLLIVLLILYPFAISAMLNRFGVLSLGTVFIALLLLRLLLFKSTARIVVFSIAGLSTLFLLALAYTDSSELLKLYPAFVNLGCLIAFGLTLVNPPSMIERIARLAKMEMSPQGIHYTRAVTMIWCVFFIINGAIITWLAYAGTNQSWARYTGFYSYIAMGSLFAIEYMFRGRYQKHVRRKQLHNNA